MTSSCREKDIPVPNVSSSEYHLAGMLSKPLNYQQMLNMLEKRLNPSFSFSQDILNTLILNVGVNAYLTGNSQWWKKH